MGAPSTSPGTSSLEEGSSFLQLAQLAQAQAQAVVLVVVAEAPLLVVVAAASLLVVLAAAASVVAPQAD
jgi:hypothetical protein